MKLKILVIATGIIACMAFSAHADPGGQPNANSYKKEFKHGNNFADRGKDRGNENKGNWKQARKDKSGNDSYCDPKGQGAGWKKNDRSNNANWSKPGVRHAYGHDKGTKWTCKAKPQYKYKQGYQRGKHGC